MNHQKTFTELFQKAHYNPNGNTALKGKGQKSNLFGIQFLSPYLLFSTNLFSKKITEENLFYSIQNDFKEIKKSLNRINLLLKGGREDYGKNR